MKVKTIKTERLIGAALDWAVAKCEKPEWLGNQAEVYVMKCGYSPSTDWAQGGPIIEREGIEIVPDGNNAWDAAIRGGDGDDIAHGPTPLIAAMRCYVASEMGDSVEVPDAITA